MGILKGFAKLRDFGDVISGRAALHNSYIRIDAPEGIDTSANTFSVNGEMKEQGFVCGSSYLAPNMTVKISRSGVTAEILITDITKAG